MLKTEKLSWEGVLPAAREAFDIWVGQPELRWAKKAWRHITSAGLANYTNELEYYMACVRFLALADVYHDWCAIAWDENHSYEDILYAAEEFRFDPFRLGQLIGPKELFEECDSTVELTNSAIGHLVISTRPEVVKAILRGFKRETALFVSLYNSNETNKRNIIKEWEINSVEAHFSDAWAWLTCECPPWRLGSCAAI